MKDLNSREKKVSRRRFIHISVLTAAGIAIAACAEPVAEPVTDEEIDELLEVEEEVVEEEPEEVVEEPVEEPRREAPMLAALVDAGELPPVDERLPVNPSITPVYEEIGNYGGSIRRGFSGVADRWGPHDFAGRTLGVYRWDGTFEPDLVESWEISEDAHTTTFHLREGLKWSDGEPLTSADFEYYYEHVLKDYTFASGDIRRWYYLTGEGDDEQLGEFSAPDDYTAVWTFAHPHPLFVDIGWGNVNYYAPRGPMQPAHYMRQFHMELTDDKDKLEQQVKDAGYATWDAYYFSRADRHLNPEFPDVGAFLFESDMAREVFQLVRNPYFWGVDPEGNQLPYIDNVVYRLFETREVFNLWVTAGDIDWQENHVQSVDYTLYKENEEQGEYEVISGSGSDMVGLNPNIAPKDPYVRELLGNRDVRIALSVAVDREMLNELVYDGQRHPAQSCPVKDDPHYWEELYYHHIEYDPEKANELLDTAGYTERDSEGFRLWKDGSGRAGFTITSTGAPGSPGVDAIEVLTDYYEDVGLDVDYRLVEPSLGEELRYTGEIEAEYGGGGIRQARNPIVMPVGWLGISGRIWSGAWGLWKDDPDDPNGERPPEGNWIWDLWKLGDEIAVEPDRERRAELFRGILEIWYEQLPAIMYLGPEDRIGVRKKGLRNIALRGDPRRNTNSATFFWEEPEKHTVTM